MANVSRVSWPGRGGRWTVRCFAPVKAGKPGGRPMLRTVSIGDVLVCGTPEEMRQVAAAFIQAAESTEKIDA